MTDSHGFDLLAVEAFTWPPHLETACEICLGEAERGRRVGFVFLDVDNLDEFPGGTIFCRAIHRLLRGARRKRVEAIEAILRSHGVTVIPTPDPTESRTELTSREAGIDSAAALREFRPEGAALGLGVLSSVIFHAGDIDPDISAHRRLIDRLLIAAQRSFRLTRRLLAEQRPADVLVFNGRFACAKGIAEAARLGGARVLYHEVGATPDRYYLADRTTHSASNARAMLREAWDRAGEDRETVAATFFAPGRGGARLLEQRHANPQRPGVALATAGRRRVVYYASSIDEFAAVDDGLGDGVFASQRAAVEWLVAWVRSRPDTELVIRVHPRMRRLSPRERAWWQSLAGDNVTTLPAEHPADSYALAASADRVVVYHSSLAPEATWLGKVAILVGDASYRGLDCVYEPGTVAELEALLDDATLPPKPRANCLPFGYDRMRRGTPFRFYEPTSFRTGRFFGVPVPTKPSPLIRVAAKALAVLDTLARRLRHGFSG